MSHILDRLASLRKAKNLSQIELADKVGVSREMIGKYERGITSPTLDTACEIAAILGVSLDYLAGKGMYPYYDLKTLRMLEDLEQVSPNIKEKLLYVVEAVIRDSKTSQTYY